ncbi:TBC1 domain family member 20 isoform X2 [Drosophila ananassae]|nr:TBC1 domain family member 20 isoform X2 [Drosophila ananassae]
MDKLSTTHFSECMQETMEATQKRLMFIWPVIKFENAELYEFLQSSSVGTLFSLPWYLTWFGHSLNSYKTVVRLYDYFLASPIYTPIFLTAAILLHRCKEILEEDCDMAAVHCLISRLPEDLPFEDLIKASTKLYAKYSLEFLENEVEKLMHQEREQRLMEEKMLLETSQKRLPDQ